MSDVTALQVADVEEGGLLKLDEHRDPLAASLGVRPEPREGALSLYPSLVIQPGRIAEAYFQTSLTISLNRLVVPPDHSQHFVFDRIEIVDRAGIHRVTLTHSPVPATMFTPDNLGVRISAVLHVDEQLCIVVRNTSDFELPFRAALTYTGPTDVRFPRR